MNPFPNAIFQAASIKATKNGATIHLDSKGGGQHIFHLPLRLVLLFCLWFLSLWIQHLDETIGLDELHATMCPCRCVSLSGRFSKSNSSDSKSWDALWCSINGSRVNGTLMWIRYIDHHWSLNYHIFLICLILSWTQFCWNSAVQRRIASTSEELLKAIAKANKNETMQNALSFNALKCLEHAFLAETEWWTFQTMQDVAVVTHRDHCDSLSGCYARRVVEIHSTNERAGAWRPIGNVTAFESCGFRIKIIAAWSKSSVLRRIWLFDVKFCQMLCELFEYWGNVAS